MVNIREVNLSNRRGLLSTIGKQAQVWRETCTDFTQTDMGGKVGLSFGSISKFECGGNDSASILLTYMVLGFNPFQDYIKRTH